MRALAVLVGRRGGYLAILSLVLQLSLASERPLPAAAGLVESQTSLGSVPEGVVLIQVSPDGRRLAAIVPSKNWKRSLKKAFMPPWVSVDAPPGRMWVDGELGPEYRLVASPTFSPDGKRFAYLVMLSPERFKGTRQADWPDGLGPFQVVLDGDTGPVYPAAAPPTGGRSFVFTPDSRKILYQVIDGDEAILMENREEAERFPGGIGSVVFDPTGEHRAIAHFEGDMVVIYLDGKKIATHENAGMLTFSEVGAHFAYAALLEEGWSAVVDGVEGPGFDWIWRPILSPAGDHVAHWAIDGKEKLMLLDGREVGRGELLSSLTRDQFLDALGPVFSPDGESVAYVLTNGKNSTLVVGAAKFEFEKALPFGLTFSPSGGRFAHALFKDREEVVVVVVDGEELSTGFHKANRVLFQWHVHMNRPLFSPDGRHVVYLKTKKPKFWHRDPPNLQLVIDQAGSSFFDTLHAMDWSSPRQLWAVVSRGGEYLRLEIEVPD